MATDRNKGSKPDPGSDPDGAEESDREQRLGEQLEAVLSTRLARRIVGVTFGGILVIGALAWWVIFVPYTSGGPTPITCGAILDSIPGPEGEQIRHNYDEGCDEAKSTRRNTALIIAGLVVVAAATVSTWPSGRLTEGPDGSGRDGTVGGDGSGGDTEAGASELVRLGLVDPDGRVRSAEEGPAPVARAALNQPAPKDAPKDAPVQDGPASELIRLGLIDPADVAAAEADAGQTDGDSSRDGDPSS